MRLPHFTGVRSLQDRGQKTENRGQNRAKSRAAPLQTPTNLMAPNPQCGSGKNHLNTSIDATEVALPTAQTNLMNRGGRKQRAERRY